MSGYKLRSDETKILTCTQARRCGDDREQACVELTLTNRNLIYVWQIRKMFGKGAEHEDVYPLSRLKVLDGVVQAKYAEKTTLRYWICSSPRMRCHSCLRPVTSTPVGNW